MIGEEAEKDEQQGEVEQGDGGQIDEQVVIAHKLDNEEGGDGERRALPMQQGVHCLHVECQQRQRFDKLRPLLAKGTN